MVVLLPKKKRFYFYCVCKFIPKKKRPCSKCKKKRKNCCKTRPVPIIYPISPNSGNIQSIPSCFTQESIGNIVLTNASSEILLWEREPSTPIQMVRVSVYNNPENMEPMTLRVESDRVHEMEVFPGNTANYWVNRARKLSVYLTNPKPSSYVEGRYAVQATILLS